MRINPTNRCGHCSGCSVAVDFAQSVVAVLAHQDQSALGVRSDCKVKLARKVVLARQALKVKWV